MEASTEHSDNERDWRGWAEARGLAAVLGLKVTMVSGLVSEETLHRLGFGWSNAPTLEDALHSPVAILRERCARFLEEQGERRKVALRDDAALVRGYAPPENHALLMLHRALLVLRQRLVLAIGPRAREVPRARFERDLDGPGFRARLWVSDPLYAARGDGQVWIDAARFLDEPLVSKCSCTAGRSGTPCIHALVAVDETLAWVCDPKTPEREPDMVAMLAEPPWKRLLTAIDASLKVQPQKAEIVAWRLRTDNGLVLEPCIKKYTRNGALSAGSRIDPARLSALLGATRLPADLRAADALQRDALFEAVEALVGHERLCLDGVPVSAVRASLGVAIVDTDKGLVLQARIDGAPLPSVTALRDALDAQAAGLVMPDADAFLVRVVRFESPLREVIHAALKHPHPIPKAERAALLARLPALERVASVALPETLRGEMVSADPRLVLRLHALATGVSVHALVNPLALPHAPTFKPGEGPEEVAGERAGTRIFTRRDKRAERDHAERIIAALPLGPADTPWQWTMRDDEAALDLLAAVRALDEPIEAEWQQESPRQLRYAGIVHARDIGMQVKKGRDWFELEGEVSLDGDRIKLGDLLESMRRGHRYVRIDLRRWIKLEQSLRERLERIAEVVHKNRGKLELGRHGAPALRALEESEVRVESDDAWKAVLQNLAAARNLDPEVPAGLCAELRPYQREGFAWMCRLATWGTGGILADDMGLGKTIQTLALLVRNQHNGPALVVCPRSLCTNWLRECERFTPTLKPRLWKSGERAGPCDLIVVSYGIATREHEELSALGIETLILDEAQAVKNADTARAKAVRAIQAKVRFGLSGTPIENHLGELWSVMRTVSPGLLGSWEQFRQRFLTPIEKGNHPRRRQMLADLVRPFVLRRTKAEVLRELPQKTDIRIEVTASAEERQLYETARLSAVTELARVSTNERKDARFQVLAAITRLRLLACHPRLFDPRSTLPSSKLAAFLRLVVDLVDNRHRALVFSQFTSHLALVREALDARGIKYCYLDGATPPAERQRQVDAFQRGAGSLFLISLKAGGFGLNLTAADDVVHLDPWWNPAVEEQAIGRAHRIGQTRPVTVYRLVAAGTLEEQILRLHQDKRDLIAGVLDDNDVAARLSLDELKALLRNHDPCM